MAAMEPLRPFLLGASGMAEEPCFPDTPFERVRAAVRLLCRTAALARTFAENGRRLDLTGLDNQVGLLCAQALNLSHEDAPRAGAELGELLREIDALAEAMQNATARAPP